MAANVTQRHALRRYEHHLAGDVHAPLTIDRRAVCRRACLDRPAWSDISYTPKLRFSLIFDVGTHSKGFGAVKDTVDGYRSSCCLLLVMIAHLSTVPLFATQIAVAEALRGEVHDATGAAIPNVEVVVRNAAVGFSRTLLTDADGRFQLDGLAPGDYEVTASTAGLRRVTERVTVKRGDQERITIVLDVAALSEAVEVFSSRVAGVSEELRRLPGSIEIVDRQTLESSHVLTTNEALRKVSGINVRDEEGLGLRPNIGIRGLNPTRSSKMLLLEDGIPLSYAPYGDNASYYHPPIERFESIEVLKGSGQIAYGPSTVGGVINYITPRPPQNRSGSLVFEAGNRSYFNGQATLGGTVGRTGVLVNYMRKQGDGARENTHTDLNDVNGKITVTLRDNQMLSVRGGYYTEDSNVTYSGLREDEYRASARQNPFKNDFFYGDRYGTSASYTYAITSSALLTTNLYQSSFSRRWWRQSSNSGQRPNDSADPACGGMASLSDTCGNEGRLRYYDVWGVEPRLRLDHRLFGVRNETDLGVRLHFETQDRRQENGDAPTSRTGRLVEDNLRQNQAHASFVQNRVVLENWALTPGVRVEHVRYQRNNRLANNGAGARGETLVTQVVPGLGLAYSSNDRYTAFAGVHRGFAPPRTEDIITNAGGTVDLDPELSWNYEVGARSLFAPGARLDATFFRMDYENQIVPASLAGGVGATLTNGGRTLHQGVEFSGRLDIGTVLGTLQNVYGRIAYTYLPVARFTGIRLSGVPGFGDVQVSGNRLPYAPLQTITTTIGYYHPAGADVMLEAAHVSSQFSDDLNTITATLDGQRGLIPAYTLLNASASYHLRRAPMTLFITVKNLSNATAIVDRSRGILPSSPRLVQVGARLRF